MWDYLSGLGALIIPVAAIVFAILAGIITTIAQQWRKVRIAEMDASLKADMIRQGRSADEIERILKMSSKTTKPYQEGC